MACMALSSSQNSRQPAIKGNTMNRTRKTFNFVACLALLTAVPAFTQAPSPEATPEAKAAAPIADVYVQTHQGVEVFNAAADGKLTLIKDSPFATTGQMAGSNGARLISVGTDYIHAYTIESSGAVGKQASEIDTQHYSGAECGNTDGAGAILDHTGHYFYVQLFGATSNGGEENTCAAWQTYKVELNGEFTFLGSNKLDYGSNDSAASISLPTFSSNDKFAYSSYGTDFAPAFAALERDSSGVLEEMSTFRPVNPTPDPSPTDSTNYYYPTSMAADPAGHLAVAMVESFAIPYPGPPLQLASYTINSTTGAIESTNTWADMPKLWGDAGVNSAFTLNMSPSGKLLAVGSYPGLKIFHFNGAAPITSYSALRLPEVDIDQLAWDNTNHLYALSYSAGELYVYTVTPTSISEVSGSPYKVKNAYGLKGLIVVPKL
jgi:hypothetical protein